TVSTVRSWSRKAFWTKNRSHKARIAGLYFASAMVSLFSATRNTLLNLAFPQRCHSCAAQVGNDFFGVACSDCWEHTTFFENSEELCSKCGAISSVSGLAVACRNCTDHQYDDARSIGIYEFAMSATVLHLKRCPVIPRILFDQMSSILASQAFGDCDFIVPVPLSAKRRAERGFNQAEHIASHVSEKLGIPIDAQSLSRKLHTPMHRASMDKKARELSVKNAFEVIRPKLVAGRSILLVDDIFTSGATVSNCAKALKKNGAARVSVFTLARAPIGQTS
ncbi:MAG: ComF family protein, partial [Pyrinomonadaceae bacterium]